MDRPPFSAWRRLSRIFCRRRGTRYLALAGLASSAMLPSPARAQQITNYQGPAGGDWFNPANWTNGVPTSAGALSDRRIAYIWNGTGPTLNNQQATAQGLTVGHMISGAAIPGANNGFLNITNFSDLETVGTSSIGGNLASAGFTQMGVVNINTGSSWYSAQDIAVGVTSIGELNIASGAKVDASFSLIGTQRRGSVTIDGNGSLFRLREGLIVGNGSQGTVTLTNGGTLQNAHQAIIAGNNSKVEIANGTWNSGQFIELRSGSIVLSAGALNVGTESSRQSIWFSQPDHSATITIQGGTLQASEIDGGIATSRHLLEFQGSGINDTFHLSADIKGQLAVELSNQTVLATGNWTNDTGDSIAAYHSNVINYATLQIGNGGTKGSLNGGRTLLNSPSARLVFNRSDASSSNSAISGSGMLEQQGAGLLTLTGTVAPSLARITVSGAGDLLISSPYSMSGTEKFGTGKLILTAGGDSLFGRVAQGTLQLGNGGTVGVWNQGVLENHGEIVLDSTNDFVLPVGIEGTGRLTKLGSNKVTLTNSMEGLLGETSVAGTLAYSIDGAGVGADWNSRITGSGTFRKEGTGALNMKRPVETNGGIEIAGGTLRLFHHHNTNVATSSGSLLGLEGIVFSGAMTGNGNLQTTNGTRITGSLSHTGSTFASGRLVFESDQEISLSGSFTAGQVEKLRTNSLVFTGPTSVSSLEIGNGRVKIGNGGTSGTLSGDVVFSGSGFLEFSRSDNSVFSGSISQMEGHGGTLLKTGAGALTIDGNIAVRTTTVSGGALVVKHGLSAEALSIASGAMLSVGDGGSTGLLSANVANAGTLHFNRNTSSTYEGVISGSGRVSKLGDGILALTATGGSTGALNVNGGTLLIQNGNTYSNSTTSGIGDLAGVPAAITVRNTGSRWMNASDLYIGNLGNGTLNVLDGGLVRNTFALLGRTGSGTANIAGAGSRWENSQGLVVGFQGPGFLNISSGGYVSNAEGILGGDGAGAAIVTGAGSQWISSSYLDIGLRAAGSLTLGPGATATVGGGNGIITLGRSGSSSGILTIGQTNGAAGDANGSTVKAAEITGGAGTGTKQVVFDTSSTLDFQPNITGTASVALVGSGRIHLNGTNSYSGTTTITRGTLGSTANGSLSPNSAVILGNSSDAALQIGTTSQTIASLAGGGATGGGVTMDTGGSLTLGGSHATTAFDGMLGASGGTQSATIIKKGNGTFTLGGSTNNLNLGGLVEAGILVLGKNSSSTVHAIGRDVTIQAGATLRLAGSGGDQIAKSAVVTVNAGGSFDLGGRSEGFKSLLGSGTITSSAAATMSTLTVGEENGSSVFAGRMADGASAAKLTFTKVGSGTLTLSGTSTIGGAFRLDEGTTTLTGSITHGGLGTIGANGGSATLNVNGSEANWTSTVDTLFGADGGTGTLNITNGAAASDTFALVGRTSGSTGNVTVNGAGSSWTHSAGLVIGTGGTGTMLVSAGGRVSNADGTVGGDASSSGTVTVSGENSRWISNSYLVVGNNGSGGLTIADGGTVKVGPAGAGTLTLANAGAATGTLNIGASIGQPAVAPGLLEAASVTGGAGSGIKLVNFNHTGTDYTFAPQLTGSVGIQQTSGTTVLSGTNTYTGATTIAGGTLIVNGSIDTSALASIVGGVLAGSGTVGAVAIQNGGTISPGNSPGILNTGSETWDGGGIYVWELNSATGTTGTNWDSLNITGTLTIHSAIENPFVIELRSLTLDNHAGDLANFDPAQTYTWIIATASGGIAGLDAGGISIDTSAFSNAAGSDRFTISSDGHNLILTYTAVPESGAFGVALGIGLMILVAQRRRVR